MGSGKSSIGRRLARLTGLRFADTDEMIVEKAGMPITAIFAKQGEEYFRNLETETLRSLLETSGIILATGGGIILREENRALLRKIGDVVWLDAHPDTLFARVSRNKKRPLLHTETPRHTFDNLLAFRNAIYHDVGTVRIDSTNFDHEHTARAVLTSLQKPLEASSPNDL
jgi:shikimate kinase